MMGGGHDIIVEDASSGSERWIGQCNGLHQTILPQLCSFLCTRP
jgi:hypothetical protein